MDDRSMDVFGPVKENSDDNVEEEEEEEELDEEQEKEEVSTSSKRKEKLRTVNQTMIRGSRYVNKWAMISKNSTRTKSSSSWI